MPAHEVEQKAGKLTLLEEAPVNDWQELVYTHPSSLDPGEG